MNALVNNVKKIAILRANALGDCIFVLPAIAALKKTYPKSELIYLGAKLHKDLLIGRTPVDRVIVLPDSIENIENMQDFFQNIQNESIDIALQLHGGGADSNTFLLQLGAKLTVGLRTPNAPLLDRWIPYVYYQREVLRYREVVSLIGATSSEINPQITVLEKDLTSIKKYKVKKPYVILHPGVTDIKRRWPVEKFAEVGNYVYQKGFNIVITGTKPEHSLTQKLQKLLTLPSINLSGTLDISALIGLLSQSELTISNDTGPLHMAAATRTKTIGIYWCGNVINSGPMSTTNHRMAISWNVMCLICKTNIANQYPFDPNKDRCSHDVSFVKDVSTNDVITQVNDLLQL